MTNRGDRPLDDREVAGAIERLLRERRADATICPSEVARDLVGSDGPWRESMEQVRGVAASMVAEGRLRVTRGDLEVDAKAPGGPIRLGLPRRPHPGER